MSEEIAKECPDCKSEKLDAEEYPCSKCALGCFDINAPLLFEPKELDKL